MVASHILNKSRQKKKRDFPGSSVVKTSPSIAKGVGSIPGWGVKISHDSRSKTRT